MLSSLLLLALPALIHANPLNLVVSPSGTYTLSSPTWPNLVLQSAPMSILQNGVMVPVSLLGGVETSVGVDSWGAYNATTLSWALPTTTTPIIVTTFMVYSTTPAILFKASFPNGLTTGEGETTGDKEGVANTFPSFQLPAAGSPLGFLQWAGPFINNGLKGPQFGPFAQPGKDIVSGLSSGPIVIMDASGAASLMLSSASEFMAVSANVSTTGDALSFGPMGSFATLPINYSYSCVAWMGAGINANIQAWGAALMRKYGKPHGLSKDDFTNTHLIYNTDHGAYYYYNTQNYSNYSAVLDAVYDYSQSVNIPYRGVLLDSWWYFKGENGGVKNWTAMPSVFTGGNAGIRALVEKTDWKITAHNRYWSANTDYARQNGGDFDFFVDPQGQGSMAVPLEQRFWEYLLTDSVTEWSLNTYEQDWLYNELQGVSAILYNVTLGKQWLIEMGAGAETAGVSIQLCMAYPRHTLATLQMPTATQIRASDDHVPGKTGGDSTSQWKLGYSSMLAWALGLAPFKDNMWSTAEQPGSSCGANAMEITPSLHNAASTFSAGPVSPGDGVGMSDVPQIMRSCTASGRLLHPSRPMTALDSQVLGDVFGAGAGRPTGDVYATYSVVSTWAWDHVMGVNLQSPYSVTQGDLEGIRGDLSLRSASAAPPPGGISYSVNASTMEFTTLKVLPFSATQPIPLAACGFQDFQVVHTAPVFTNGWALLGELSKWVPVAEARLSDISMSSSDVTMVVTGQAGESVPITFYNTLTSTTVTVVCVLPEGGVATLSVAANACG